MTKTRRLPKQKKLFCLSSVSALSRPFKTFFPVINISVGFGEVLLKKKQQGEGQICVFFSKTFSPAENNRDQELLAIKLALEDWHHLHRQLEPALSTVNKSP